MFTKRLIQIAISIGVIAFILSMSRVFLSLDERHGSSDFYIYNLNLAGPLSAFLSIIIISTLIVIIGAYLNKRYDIIGMPLIISGIFTLTLISIINYIAMSSGTQDNTTSNIILLVIFSIELIGLIAFAELKLPNIIKIENHKPAPPLANPVSGITQPPTGIQ
ncbi:MAG: hypothetical protein Q7S37_01765 [bacterium]|nr:hypothetical protein [bacterium]